MLITYKRRLRNDRCKRLEWEIITSPPSATQAWRDTLRRSACPPSSSGRGSATGCTPADIRSIRRAFSGHAAPLHATASAEPDPAPDIGRIATRRDALIRGRAGTGGGISRQNKTSCGFGSISAACRCRCGSSNRNGRLVRSSPARADRDRHTATLRIQIHFKNASNPPQKPLNNP